MKSWLLKLPGFRWAYRQGGIDSFPLAHKDILETFAGDVDKRAEELAKEQLERLLSPIERSTIVTFDQRAGAVFIGGERAEESRLNNLKAEADFLMESDIWKVLHETPKALAEKAMFVEGDNLDTMKKGRSMLYTLSTQQKIIDVFRSYQKK